MTDCVEAPAIPANVADAWAAVYIDVGEKLAAAKGEGAPEATLPDDEQDNTAKEE
jgi:hypothetical protein